MLPNDRFRYRSTTGYARSIPPSPCPTGWAAKWREALGHAETPFHDIAAAFAKGEAILFAETRRIDSELIEENARMARLLAIDGQNQLLKEEEEAIARALCD